MKCSEIKEYRGFSYWIFDTYEQHLYIQILSKGFPTISQLKEIAKIEGDNRDILFVNLPTDTARAKLYLMKYKDYNI